MPTHAKSPRRWLPLLAALAASPAWAFPSDPGHEQRLVFHVAGPIDGSVSGMRLEWLRLDAPRVTVLVDDGSLPVDTPWDGVWSGVDEGPFVRDAAMRLSVVDLDGVEHLLWSGLVHPENASESVIQWRVLGVGAEARAQRVAAAWPGSAALLPEGAWIYAGMAWSCLIVVLAAGLLHAARPGILRW
jgi:hypothetical protein